MDGYEKRSLQKKNLVQKTAFELMRAPNGIKNLTMDELAEKSGVSKASIFKYFGSKDLLIQHVFIDYLDDFNRQNEIVLQSGLNFEDSFMALAELKVNELKKVDEDFFRTILAMYSTPQDDDFGRRVAEYNQQSAQTMKMLFDQGRKEGKIDHKYTDEFLSIYIASQLKGMTDPEIYQKVDIYFTKNWTEMLLKALAPTKQDSAK